MYLYIASEDDFSCVPQGLMARFGTPVLVMDITLTEQRQLAREDVTVVMANLRSQGFHLQMPPKIDVDLYRGD
jgi:uncharacterized protein YcgL (UPF0745 family)